MESNREEITFAFGLKDSAIRRRLTVNKKLLIENSSVFERMLSGNFAIPDVIAIEDIPKSIFQKMVSCFNGEAVEINKSYVLRLMYAAEKYMFEPLSLLCEKFIIDLVTSDDNYALRMLNYSLKYNRVAIKEKCLPIILDDPMRFFEHDKFLDIKEDTLKLILTQPKMNCTVLYLLRAAKKWLEHNDIAKVATSNDVYAVLKTKFGIEETVMKNKQLYQIKYFSANADHKFIKKFKEITEDISLWNCGSHLYGLVLLIGVHPEREKEFVGSDYLTDTVSINIKVKHKSYDFNKVVRVVNQPLSKATTIKIMFPKAKIPQITLSEACLSQSDSSSGYKSKLHIEIDFGSEKFRSVLNKHNCGGTRGYVKTDNNCEMYHSVVSELLYSADHSSAATNSDF